MILFYSVNHRPPAAGAPMTAKKHRRRISDIEFTSHVAAGTEIHGAYGGKTHLLIEGTMHGDVEINGTVMVGPTGKVEGSVKAANAVIEGHVAGDVRAKKVAEIRRRAVIDGGVAAQEVYVAVGAKVGGEIIASHKKGTASFNERRHGGREAAGS
jgi:cytoskeletal protein CcmA (bactofilin family)